MEQTVVAVVSCCVQPRQLGGKNTIYPLKPCPVMIGVGISIQAHTNGLPHRQKESPSARPSTEFCTTSCSQNKNKLKTSSLEVCCSYLLSGNSPCLKRLRGPSVKTRPERGEKIQGAHRLEVLNQQREAWWDRKFKMPTFFKTRATQSGTGVMSKRS